MCTNTQIYLHTYTEYDKYEKYEYIYKFEDDRSYSLPLGSGMHSLE